MATIKYRDPATGEWIPAGVPGPPGPAGPPGPEGPAGGATSLPLAGGTMDDGAVIGFTAPATSGITHDGTDVVVAISDSLSVRYQSFDPAAEVFVVNSGGAVAAHGTYFYELDEDAAAPIPGYGEQGMRHARDTVGHTLIRDNVGWVTPSPGGLPVVYWAMRTQDGDLPEKLMQFISGNLNIPGDLYAGGGTGVVADLAEFGRPVPDSRQDADGNEGYPLAGLLAVAVAEIKSLRERVAQLEGTT